MTLTRVQITEAKTTNSELFSQTHYQLPKNIGRLQNDSLYKLLPGTGHEYFRFNLCRSMQSLCQEWTVQHVYGSGQDIPTNTWHKLAIQPDRPFRGNKVDWPTYTQCTPHGIAFDMRVTKLPLYTNTISKKKWNESKSTITTVTSGLVCKTCYI